MSRSRKPPDGMFSTVCRTIGGTWATTTRFQFQPPDHRVRDGIARCADEGLKSLAGLPHTVAEKRKLPHLTGCLCWDQLPCKGK